jgi:PAS domain S-box-containing protein
LKIDTLFDAVPFALMAHDTKRHISYFNIEAERITGYSRAEVIGKDCHEAFPGGFCGEKCSFRKGIMVPTFDELHYPVDFLNKNGEKFLLDVRVRPVFGSSGGLSGVVVTFEDVANEIKFEKGIGKITEFCGIVGKNEKMLRLYQQIRNVSRVSFPVLILGESGTGKELVAQAIHRLSIKREGQFVPLNCGSIPDTLIESELFGHVRGAFTGAVRDKKGKFELAHRGTIFLDEIGDISPMMQVKLLRVIQTGMVEKLGETRPYRIDVRIISATNKDLRTEMREGRFRKDLFYRISVIPIELPPLRDRKDDIPLLVGHFLKDFSKGLATEKFSLSRSAMDTLLDYEWPGNIRELQNVLQYALVQANEEKKGIIGLRHLPESILKLHTPGLYQGKETTKKRKKRLDEDRVREALHETNGNKVRAARILGVSRATLYRFLGDMKQI